MNNRRPMQHGRSVLPGLLLALTSCNPPDTPTGSHALRPITETDSCAGCAIEIAEVARLGNDNNPLSIHPHISSEPCKVAPLPGQRWLVSGLVGRGELGVFNADGTLERTIGRSGQGPGEYGSNLHVIAKPEGDVLVVDNSSLRMTALHNDEPVYGAALPRRVQSMALLEGGELLLHGRPSAYPKIPAGALF